MKARLFRVNNRELIEYWNRHIGETIRIPVIKNIPSDAVITAVEYSFRHDCLIVRVEHESYEVVPENTAMEIGPVLDFEYTIRKLA